MVAFLFFMQSGEFTYYPAIVVLFLSNCFQSSSSDGKYIPSYLHLFIKGLTFVILSGCYSISS